jgi:poly-gamma-glutamate synthesis protein (capsule biosynthesis protein)
VPASAKEIFGILEGMDYAVGNFEMPLTDRGNAVEKLLNIRAHPAIGGSLSVLGLNLVSVANNHSVDYGWEGLAQTVEVLRASGLRVVGAGRNINEAQEPEVAVVKGKKIGVIAFSCLLPTGMAASSHRPGISPIHVNTSYEVDPYYQMEEPGDISVVRVRTQARDSDLSVATSAITTLKKHCDVVIVTIHWGFGSGDDLAEYQMPLARRLIDGGADIIHGHHPHAIHAISFYKGKPILFSLGTLVGQQVFLDASPAIKTLWAGMSPDGYVAAITVLDRDRMTIELTPTTLDADRLPIIAKGAVFNRIQERLSRLSAPHGVLIEKHGAILRVKAMPTTIQ